METAIVISSCDLYKDCWRPMIHSIKKYWTDCPFSIYVISNNEQIEEDGIDFIKVGAHKGFGSNLSKALDRIDSEYIILLLDDYFLEEKVNTEFIISHIKHCKEKEIDFLKIDARDMLIRDSLQIDGSIYCENPIDVTYSVNTAIAIWSKKTLKKIAVEGFSPWDFERKIIPYIIKNKINIKSEVVHSSEINRTIKAIEGGAVYRGLWTLSGVRFLKENHFDDLLATRKHQWGIFFLLNFLYKKYYCRKSFLRYPMAFIMRIIIKLNQVL